MVSFSPTVLLGIASLIFLFITATLGWLLTKGKVKLITHKTFAFITIAIAVTHAILVIIKIYL